jgi:vitamin B12 transporter
MLMLKKIIKLLIILTFSYKAVFAADIPIIVIAPSKKAQSSSIVGTSVTVLDETFFKNSNEFFLGDALASNSTSANFFQSGGQGQTSAIQLRGLPKRYSTVYIDGVKMLDPSSSDGSFYMENIMKNSIDRVEILKGTQSSLYGSNAIGGTIHIFTKKGRKGYHSNFAIENGSNNTKNLAPSME